MQSKIFLYRSFIHLFSEQLFTVYRLVFNLNIFQLSEWSVLNNVVGIKKFNNICLHNLILTRPIQPHLFWYYGTRSRLAIFAFRTVTSCFIIIYLLLESAAKLLAAPYCAHYPSLLLQLLILWEWNFIIIKLRAIPGGQRI